MKNNFSKWIGLAALALLAVWGARHTTHPNTEPQQNAPQVQTAAKNTAAEAGGRDAETVLQQAYEQQRSNIQVEGSGTVVKTLPDDTKGTQHQRFIIKLDSGQTLLVAHNIDLADKLKGLKKGDRVGFYGEYEWSEQGGVIHWTHHDPAGRHPDGWLEYKGKTYR